MAIAGQAHWMGEMLCGACLYQASMLSSQGRGFGFLRPIVSTVVAGGLPVRSPCCCLAGSYSLSLPRVCQPLRTLRFSVALIPCGTSTPKFLEDLTRPLRAGPAEKNLPSLLRVCQALRSAGACFPIPLPRWLQLECLASVSFLLTSMTMRVSVPRVKRSRPTSFSRPSGLVLSTCVRVRKPVHEGLVQRMVQS